MVVVEMVAIADGLKILCKTCYTLEGDSQLILREKSAFDRVKDKFMAEKLFSPRLTTAVDKALPMVKEVEDMFSNNLAQVRTELEQIEGSVAELKGKVKELVDK